MNEKEDKKIGEKGEQEKKSEALLKEFMEKHTKEIPFTGLSSELKGQFQWVINELLGLGKEIEEKRASFLNQNEEIKKRISDLVKTGKWSVDKGEYEKSQEGVREYENLLNSVKDELEKEFSFFKDFSSENPPKNVRVLKTDSDDVNDFFADKIKNIKRYVKKVRKDLRVSYSKYDFAFQNQIHKLDYIYAYIKHMEKRKK